METGTASEDKHNNSGKSEEDLYSDARREGLGVFRLGDGDYENTMKQLESALKDQGKLSVLLEDNIAKKWAIQALQKLGFPDIVKPEDYISRGVKKLETVVTMYDADIRKRDVEVDKVDRQLNQFLQYKDRAATARKLLEECVEKAYVSRENMLSLYKQKGEDMPSREQIRNKEKLIERAEDDLDMCERAIEHYQKRIGATKVILSKLKEQKNKARDYKGKVQDVIAGAVIIPNTSGNNLELEKHGLEGRKVMENVIQKVEIYNTNNKSEEISAESLPDLDLGRMNYSVGQDNLSEKAQEEERKRKRDERKIRIDEILSKGEEDPFY